MNTRTRFIAGGLVVFGALGYMVYAGVMQSSVYFVTPSELLAAPSTDKAYRVGALVEKGTLRWEPRTLELTFALTDGKGTISVRHRGTPPDLFGEGRGAIVEGRWTPDGYLKATTILAKHSEDYKAPDKPKTTTR
jgi:cytochrome c-type biogenesis protein CcmE